MLIYTGKFLIVGALGYLLYDYIPVGLYWYKAWYKARNKSMFLFV